MSLEILINNSSDGKSDYVTWTPTPCKITSSEPNGVNVQLSNSSTNGGQVVFFKDLQSQQSNGLQLVIPATGEANFFIAGKFDKQTGQSYASKNDKDCVISARDASNTLLSEKSLMVRVRKNANELSAQERDRFLSAMVRLNQMGKYVELQNMHLSSSSEEIHERSCFLPWHRAFLLDIERRLQKIDPSVTVPYWKFDESANNIFDGDFMGEPDSSGLVEFTNTNPMINWKLQLFGSGNGTRIRRRNLSNNVPWDPRLTGAIAVNNSEQQTLGLGSIFSQFSTMEIDPHGMAHVSFTGQISNIGTSPADPLFFMLHCNVDRLWAKWQWVNNHFDELNNNTYPNIGNGNPSRGGENGIGNFTKDTMWPWNGVNVRPRPSTAPGGGMPNSAVISKPGKTPQVGNMLDFHGANSLTNNLGFAYDDVPFESTNIINVIASV